jgi:Winged helix DNA-binding domain
MTSSKVKKPVGLELLNSWRMHRQFLDHPYPSKNILDLIRSVGWIYSPGCSTPYLSLCTRIPSIRAEDLNKLVFDNHKLIQLETLRGCTMLVPRDQVDVALRIRTRTFTELSKQARQQMPVSEAEMEELKGAILKALHSSAKTLDQIQQAVPAKLVKDFGIDLKRIGLTSSLALAVNLLKEEGKILKQQGKKRLDSTDYSYVLTSALLPEANPFNLRMEEACAQLAAQYFRAEGPARVKDFAWWAGINVTDAIKGAAEVKPKLVPIAVDGTADEFLMSESDVDALLSFKPPDAAVSFIPYRDTYLKGQREVVNRFVPSEHADKPFSRWKGKLINDPLATIILNGSVVGVWEWNEDDEEVDLLLFDSSIPKSVEKAIHKRAGELATFIRSNLGEVRLQGSDYGPHQMTGIHDLKEFWGKGAQVDVRV